MAPAAPVRSRALGGEGGAIQSDVLARDLHDSKKLLPLQGEGGDGGGVNTVDDPTPILTFPLKAYVSTHLFKARGGLGRQIVHIV